MKLSNSTGKIPSQEALQNRPDPNPRQSRKTQSLTDETSEKVRTAPPPPLSREETFKVQPEIPMANRPLNAAAPSVCADIGKAFRTVKRFFAQKFSPCRRVHGARRRTIIFMP
jgi:hypothetical protein